jgi:ADP-ribose pyrophosphatase
LEQLEETFINSKKIFDGNMIKVSVDTVRLPNGKKATRELVTHPGAVAVVPLLADGRVVLVRQYRYPIQAITLEIPAGKLDAGEHPDHCVMRELKEETGYIANKIAKLTSVYTAPGFSNEIIHLYTATDLRLDKACPDEDEFINVEVYTRNEIRSMIHNGEITDAKTLTGLLMAGL